MLWDNHQTIYSTFAYYASLGTSDDIFHIYLNGYGQLVDDLQFAVPKSKRCQKKDLDQLFVHVNAKSGHGDDERPDIFNKSRALNRQEFLQVLTRVATMKYVMSGQMKDVSDALQMLFREDMDPRLPKEVHQDSNEFRRRYCYIEEVDKVLRKWEGSLRTLYTIYAGGDGRIARDDEVISSKLLDYPEFLKLCKDLRLIDSDFSSREATIVFIWSRMAVVAEDDKKGRIKLCHLSFEDFLEAIVRMATMKSMPFDDEIEASGSADGGQYLLELQEHPTLHKMFLDSHHQEWDDPPLQPIHRSVDHLASLIVRTVDEATKGRTDGVISKEEARLFHASGGSKRSSPSMSSSKGGPSPGGESTCTSSSAQDAKQREATLHSAITSRRSSPDASRGVSPEAPHSRGDSPLQTGGKADNEEESGVAEGSGQGSMSEDGRGLVAPHPISPRDASERSSPSPGAEELVPSPPNGARAPSTSPNGRRRSKGSRLRKEDSRSPRTLPQPSSLWPPAEPTFPPSGGYHTATGLMHVLPPMGAVQSHTSAAALMGAALANGGMVHVQGSMGAMVDSWFPQKPKPPDFDGSWVRQR